MIDLMLKDAQVGSEPLLTDIAIDDGIIVDVGPGLPCEAKQVYDLEGCLLSPGFVECHIHLDIALMNASSRPGRRERLCSMATVIREMESRRRAFTIDGIEHRVGEALRLALRHGITALRAQCQIDTEVGFRHLEALLNVRDQFSDKMTIQIVAFPQQGYLRNPGTVDLIREAIRMGADVVGGSGTQDRGDDPIRGAMRHYDAALSLAVEMGTGLDVHIDSGLPSPPRPLELDELEIVYLARKVMEMGLQGKVVAGHLNALSAAPEDVASEAISLIKEAEISVLSLPDLFRLAREDTIHVRRGLTRVQDLLAGGVNVALASNNVRDAVRPVGNLNLLEEALVLSQGAHMDTVEELDKLFDMCTYNAARALGLQRYGLDKGCAADLVVLDAPSQSAAIVDQAEKTLVFKGGKLVASNRVMSPGFL